MMTAPTVIPLIATITMLAALSRGQYMTSGAIGAAYAGHPIATNFDSILPPKDLPAPRNWRTSVTPTLAPLRIGLPSSDESLFGENGIPISSEMQDYSLWSSYMGDYRPEIVPIMAGSGPVGMYSASIPIAGLSAASLHPKPGKSLPAMYSDFGTAILAKPPPPHSIRVSSLPALGSDALLFGTGVSAFGTGVVSHPAAGIATHPAAGVTGLATGVAGLGAGIPAFGTGSFPHRNIEINRPFGVVSHPSFGTGVASFGMETAELESGVPAFGAGIISRPATIVTRPAGVVSHPAFETGVASFGTKTATVRNGVPPFKTNAGSVPAAYFGGDLFGGLSHQFPRGIPSSAEAEHSNTNVNINTDTGHKPSQGKGWTGLGQL